MKLVNKIFGNTKSDSQKVPEHAVIVHFQYGKTDIQPALNLGNALEKAIVKAGVGEYDGNEIAVDGSDGSLYMYGPDADRLYKVVRPVLESVDFMQNATVVLRYGPPGKDVVEKHVKIEVG